MNDAQKIRLCEICGKANADFVKTSTGFGFVKQANGGYNYKGATAHDLELMRAHSPARVQVKASGGIRNLDDLILARDLGKPLRDMSGSDIAYDVHVRRVFLRTGLVERDDVNLMVAAARALNPDRPGALDLPAWDIGRRWCRPANPDCLACPLNHVCPRLIDKVGLVRGV